MAGQQFYVYTRELKTKRIEAFAGKPLDSRLNTPSGREYLKRTFGRDIITEVDAKDPKAYLALIGADTDAEAGEKYLQLKALTDDQAKKIRALERENESLKKQLRRAQGESKHEN